VDCTFLSARWKRYTNLQAEKKTRGRGKGGKGGEGEVRCPPHLRGWSVKSSSPIKTNCSKKDQKGGEEKRGTKRGKSAFFRFRIRDRGGERGEEKSGTESSNLTFIGIVWISKKERKGKGPRVHKQSVEIRLRIIDIDLSAYVKWEEREEGGGEGKKERLPFPVLPSANFSTVNGETCREGREGKGKIYLLPLFIYSTGGGEGEKKGVTLSFSCLVFSSCQMASQGRREGGRGDIILLCPKRPGSG